MTIKSDAAYRAYEDHAKTCTICRHATEYPFVCLIGQQLLSKFKAAVLEQKKAISTWIN